MLPPVRVELGSLMLYFLANLACASYGIFELTFVHALLYFWTKMI